MGTQWIMNSSPWNYKGQETGYVVLGGGMKAKQLCSVVYFQGKECVSVPLVCHRSHM